MLQMVQSVALLRTYKFVFSTEEQLAQFIRFPDNTIPNLNTDLWKMNQVVSTRNPDGTIGGTIVFARNGSPAEIDADMDSGMIDLLEEDPH